MIIRNKTYFIIGMISKMTASCVRYPSVYFGKYFTYLATNQSLGKMSIPATHKIYWSLLFFITLSSSILRAQTVPPPVQTDEIIIDNGATGKADPNDRIRYRVTIVNTGGANANNVQFTAVPDPRTTFLAGSFRSSPLALPDMYASTGNVGINVPAASGVKVNDFDDNTAGLTITAGTFSTTGGGTITLASDGSFMYSPPPGFTGTDTYSYTLNDGNGVGAPVPTTDMGLITFTITNLIWFIDNSSVAATSDGRLTSPFKTLANFNAGSATAGSVVYIEHTGTDYPGGIVLQANERLFGEGHTGTATTGENLSTVIPFALAPNSKPLPNIDGPRPVITNSMGHGVALAQSNILRGFNIGSTPPASAFAGINGSGFTTVTIDEVSKTGTGQILTLTNGAVTANFDALSTTSTNQTAIILSTVSGTISDNNTANSLITGASGGFSIAGGTVSLTFNGDVNHAAANPIVQITNHATGTVIFQNGTLSNSTLAGGFAITNGDGTYNFNGTNTLANAARIVIDGGSSGTFNFSNNTSVTNPTNVALDINGSNATVDYNGTLTSNTAFRLIDIASNTGGSVSVDGNLSATGSTLGIRVQQNTGGTYSFTGSAKTITSGANTAINLVTNAGSTINFTNGGLAITTTSGGGFNATGGGNISIVGVANTISSGIGRPVNIDGTTITGITLRSVTASGSGTTSIFLNNAGSGGFTITGTGTTPGTGGTINHNSPLAADNNSSVGTGMYIINTDNISLSNMNFTGTFGNFGIRGDDVNNFTLKESNFTGIFGTNDAGGFNEGTIRFGTQGVNAAGLTGTGLFEGNFIGGGYSDNIAIFVTGAGNLNFTVKDGAHPAIIGKNDEDSDGGGPDVAHGNDGIIIETGGTGTATTLIDGVVFEGARGDLFQSAINGTSAQTISFINNTCHNTHNAIVSGGGGITLNGAGNPSNYTINYLINNNSFRGAVGSPIFAGYGGQTATISGVITNNIIGVDDAGNPQASVVLATTGASGNGNGIFVSSEKFNGSGTINHAVRIEDNQVRDVTGTGISIRSNNQGGGTCRVEATIKDNIVEEVGEFSYSGIYAVTGGASLTDIGRCGIALTNNIVLLNNSSGLDGDNNAIAFDQVAPTAHFYVPGYAGSPNGEFVLMPGTASTGLSNFLTPLNGTLTNGEFPNGPLNVDAVTVTGVTGEAFILPVP